MGVPGLWKELQSHGKDTALARLSCLIDRETTSTPSTSTSPPTETLRLGIDVSSWLFHAQKSIGGHNPQLRLLFYRLCRLLSVPCVLPIFVFDGPLRPKEKRGKVTHSYRQAAFITDFKDLIVAFGFIVYDAVGEAEAEMARMNREGILDAVMSDDVDCFVFGATTVIRNWGQELSGSKARTDFVAEKSASDGASLSSGEEQSSVPIQAKAMSAMDRYALGNNLITYFRASDFADTGITREGLVLVAILSGGDYDVQGLPRCGAKISIALAKAGFGESLIDGFRKHCKPPAHPSSSLQFSSNRLAAPEPTQSWSTFLDDWRSSVRKELTTNESGHLGRRFKKLAESAEFANLLSTKASLSVLGSYIWPLTTGCDTEYTSGKIDIGTIAQMCQNCFHWTAASTLETLRNNLWEGCAIRELTGVDINGLNRFTTTSKEKIPRVNDAKRDNFFVSKSKDASQPCKTLLLEDDASLILSIAGERKSASTSYVKEARLICDVNLYADLAKGGLDFEFTFEDHRDHNNDLPSSQSTSTSPRKRRPFADPNKELRIWVSHEIVWRAPAAQRQVEQYQSKQTAKASALDKRNKGVGASQARLENFFVGTKGNVSTANRKVPAKISPSKRRAPVPTSSSTPLSSTTDSRSPSPSLRPVINGSRQNQPQQIAVTEKERSSTTLTSMLHPKDKGKEDRVDQPAWNSTILDSDQEEDGTFVGHSSVGDSSLPSLRFPSFGKQDTVHSYDDSVEFVKAIVSPQKKKGNMATTAIDLTDDSEEDNVNLSV